MNETSPPLLPADATIKEAMEALNRSGRHLTVYVVGPNERLLGTVTDGDIRRALLAGNGVDSPVDVAMNPQPHVLRAGHHSRVQVSGLKERNIRSLPVVDQEGRLVRVIDLGTLHSIVPVHGFILAGGRGMRLRPYTDTTPKPLIPVRGRPIIEHALELMRSHGVEEVTIAVNYLKERIMEHLGDGKRFGLHIGYIEEDRPLGTAGALALLERPSQDTILMMNADLLTDIDLDGMYERFLATASEITVATTEHRIDIPYATLDMEGDRVLDYREKPTLSLPCNAGIYMLRAAWCGRVPRDVQYNATDLIQDALDQGQRVTGHAISGSWFDIGRHEDLDRARPQPGSSTGTG